MVKDKKKLQKEPSAFSDEGGEPHQLTSMMSRMPSSGDPSDAAYRKEYMYMIKTRYSANEGTIEFIKGHTILTHMKICDYTSDNPNADELRKQFEWSMWIYIKRAHNVNDKDNVPWDAFKHLHKTFVKEARHMTFDKYCEHIQYAGEQSTFEAMIAAYNYASRQYDDSSWITFREYEEFNERASELTDKWMRYGGLGGSIDVRSEASRENMNPFFRLCLEHKYVGRPISMRRFYDWMGEYEQIVQVILSSNAKSTQRLLQGETFSCVAQSLLVKNMAITFQLFVPEFRKCQHQQTNAQRLHSSALLSDIHEALHKCGLHPTSSEEVPWRAIKIFLMSDSSEKDRLHSVFNKYDSKSKNQVLTLDELMNHFSPYQSFLMMSIGDCDKNYSLSFYEFLAARDITEEFLKNDYELQYLFDHYDENKDGLIDYNEMYTFLSEQAERWQETVYDFDPLAVADWSLRQAQKDVGQLKSAAKVVCRAIFPDGPNSTPINFEEFVRNNGFKHSKFADLGYTDRAHYYIDQAKPPSLKERSILMMQEAKMLMEEKKNMCMPYLRGKTGVEGEEEEEAGGGDEGDGFGKF